MDAETTAAPQQGEGAQPGHSATKSGAHTREPCTAPLSPLTVLMWVFSHINKRIDHYVMISVDIVATNKSTFKL